MRRFFWFLRRLSARGRYQADLRRELDATHELLADEYRARGMSEDEARVAARRELGGNVDVIREDVQDAWAGAWLERFARDARYALRGLRRDRGFAVASILTFGLAIGGTTAVATLVNSLLLRPLPFTESDRLVMLMERGNNSVGAGHVASQPNIADWSARNRSLERLAYFEFQTFNVSGDQSAPQQVGGLRASHELFDVLRAKPLLGRTFIDSDDDNRNGDVVILSHSLWRERFGGDSSLVGRAILVNKRPYTVIGVMRPEMRFPGVNQKLWIPMALSEDDHNRQSQSFLAVARLKNGVTLEQAQRDMRRVGAELAREYPAADDGETVNAFLLQDLWMQNIERILRLLVAAVTLVAVMAIVNVAGLLLARGGAQPRVRCASRARWKSGEADQPARDGKRGRLHAGRCTRHRHRVRRASALCRASRAWPEQPAISRARRRRHRRAHSHRFARGRHSLRNSCGSHSRVFRHPTLAGGIAQGGRRAR